MSTDLCSPCVQTPINLTTIIADQINAIIAGGIGLDASDITSGTLLAARMPAFTGDVTTPVGSVVTTISAGVVSFSKQANLSGPGVLVGRFAAGAGSPQEITLGANLSIIAGALTAASTATTDASLLTSGTLSAARLPAFTGDVTTVIGNVATTIAAGVVTFGKQANLSGPNILVGRKTAGAGSPEEITLGANLSIIAGALTAASGSTTDASLLTSGTLNTARLTGSYTGVTLIGTQTSVTTSGTITLNNGTSNLISFGSAGTNAPTFTSRS